VQQTFSADAYLLQRWRGATFSTPRKEIVMATTADGHIHERRHIPERRTREKTSMAKRFNAIDWLSMVLLIIGGLNWGLVGLFDFDLVAALFGEMSGLSRIVYGLVGLSALYSIFSSRKMAHS
jgi:uncharacterized membrane protein YuzA (DUF378 family)